jgi:ABC-type microcin C transport system permease subunit YejE
MSGLYSQGFSPARTASPQIRGNPDHDRYSAARDLFSRSFSVILDPEVALCSLCLPLSIDAILGFYAVSTWLSFSRSIKSWGPSCRCCPCAAGC